MMNKSLWKGAEWERYDGPPYNINVCLCDPFQSDFIAFREEKKKRIYKCNVTHFLRSRFIKINFGLISDWKEQKREKKYKNISSTEVVPLDDIVAFKKFSKTITEDSRSQQQ